MPATSALSEVIVTGYQTLSKERVTGAFGLISSSKLETKLQPDLKSLLEGQAAGIVIDKKGNIEIRGVSTFNAEKTPLLVVDGYPIEGKLEDLNPDNIQNITVLKGWCSRLYLRFAGSQRGYRHHNEARSERKGGSLLQRFVQRDAET